MKLMNTQDYIKSLKELVTELGKEASDYAISFRPETSKEENGALTFVFVIRNKKSDRSKEYKIALYIFENKKTVTSFIINGRTLNMLFENSTINSPNVALHYLRDILLSEVKWIRDLEETVRKQEEERKKKRMANRGNSGKKPYNNRGGQKNFRQQSGKKNYNGNRNGGSGHHNSVGNRINIRTTKGAFGNSNTGGQK